MLGSHLASAALTLAILDSDVSIPEGAHLKFAFPSVKQIAGDATIGCCPFFYILHEQVFAISLKHRMLQIPMESMGRLAAWVAPKVINFKLFNWSVIWLTRYEVHETSISTGLNR